MFAVLKLMGLTSTGVSICVMHGIERRKLRHLTLKANWRGPKPVYRGICGHKVCWYGCGLANQRCVMTITPLQVISQGWGGDIAMGTVLPTTPFRRRDLDSPLATTSLRMFFLSLFSEPL